MILPPECRRQRVGRLLAHAARFGGGLSFPEEGVSNEFTI